MVLQRQWILLFAVILLGVGLAGCSHQAQEATGNSGGTGDQYTGASDGAGGDADKEDWDLNYGIRTPPWTQGSSSDESGEGSGGTELNYGVETPVPIPGS